MARTDPEWSNSRSRRYETVLAVCSICRREYHKHYYPKGCPDCTDPVYPYAFPPVEPDVLKMVQMRGELNRCHQQMTRYEELCQEATDSLRRRRVLEGEKHKDTCQALLDELRILDDDDWTPTTGFVYRVVARYYDRASTPKEGFHLRKQLEGIYENARDKWVLSVKNFWDHLRK